MASAAAFKRQQWIARDLEALQEACRTVVDSEVPAAFARYRVRLDEVQAGWHREMRRRAGLLLERDMTAALPVWGLVSDIRKAMGNRYGDMAAEIAVSVLGPVQRQRKPLAACKVVE